MNVLEALLNRKSTPPRLMDDHGPSPADVQDMMAAAMTAPDHGAIRPWRFVIIEGDDRATLGRVFAEALRRHLEIFKFILQRLVDEGFQLVDSTY